MQLRRWQAECLDALRASRERVDLVNATPGGGKSLLAVVASRDLHLDRDPRAGLVVVVPTDHLRTQIAASFARLGVELDLTVTPRPGFRGLVTTYAALARTRNADAVARYCRERPVLAFCDEIHHAAGQASWAAGVERAIAPARRIIALTGTAFTSNGQRIAFLPTREVMGSEGDPAAEYVATYTYPFEQALADRVIRPATFHPCDGVATYRDRRGIHTERLSSAKPSKASDVLGLLLGEEQFAKQMLERAAALLDRRRERHPDAGGLVVAVNTAHCLRLAALLEEITGVAPDVVVSDDAAATSSIQAFADDTRRRWICTIKMLSEGVDVPRLGVLAYASNVQTRLFWRQATARVLRERTGSDMGADIVFPAAPEIMTHAREMELAIMEAGGTAEATAEDAEPIGAGRPRSSKELISATVEWQPSIVKGVQGSLAIAGKVLPVPLHERMDQLRSTIQGLAARLARARRIEPRTVHVEYQKRVDPRKQETLDLAGLERKRAWLEQRLGISTAREA